MAEPIKVLIIDDDADLLAGLAGGLQVPQRSLEVLTADGGLKGLQLAKQHRPDIIILDFQMPDLNGFKVFDEIRSDDALKDTRIIMLTAQDSGKNLWESIDRQVDDFMGKPFDLTELEARINNLLPPLESTKS